MIDFKVRWLLRALEYCPNLETLYVKSFEFKNFWTICNFVFLGICTKVHIHSNKSLKVLFTALHLSWNESSSRVFFVSGKTSSTFELSFSCLANKNLITYKDFFEHLQALPNQGQKQIFLHQPKNWKINENTGCPNKF